MTAALLALLLSAAAVQVEPSSLVFGPAPAELTLQVPGAESVRVRAANGVGEVSAPAAAGPGRFKVQYTFPQARFPQVALLVVEARAASGETSLHWLAVPLLATASLKVETKPLAEVTVSIGDARFGPAETDAKGRVSIPARVPPGFPTAQVVAVDRAGNSTTTTLDLAPQPFARAAAALREPQASPDAPVEVEVFAVEPTGAPLVDAAPLQVKAARGTVDAPTRQADGVFVVRYRAPASVGAGKDALSTAVAGGPGSTFEVPLRPGGAAQVVLVLSEPAFVAGSGRPVGVTASVVDVHGNVQPGVRPQVVVDLGRLEETDGALQWVLPDAFGGRTSAKLRGAAGALRAEAVLELQPGPPRTAALTLPLNAPAGTEVRGRLDARDAWKNPVAPGAVEVVSSRGRPARVTAGEDGTLQVAYAVAKDDPTGDTDFEVRSGAQALSRARLEVLRPERPWAISVGAFVTGAWNFSQARSFSPRVGAGVRLGLSGFEAGVEGAFAWYPRLDAAKTLDGLNDASTELTAWSVGASLRYSLRLAQRWSLHASGTLGAQATTATVTAPGFETSTNTGWGLLLRGAGGVGLHALAGRVLLQLEGTWAPAPAGGRVRGNLGGLGLALGYVASF